MEALLSAQSYFDMQEDESLNQDTGDLITNDSGPAYPEACMPKTTIAWPSIQTDLFGKPGLIHLDQFNPYQKRKI